MRVRGVAGGSGPHPTLFQINIGTDAALHHEFLDFLLSEVSDSGVGTDRLYFELTDSTRLREEGRAADFARTLRSIGCQISIANVHPKRGSTTQLQSLNPNALALAETLWPLASGDNQMVALHQTISDLHHLVGESVVLRDARDEARAQELGIDFIEVSEEPDLTPAALRRRCLKLNGKPASRYVELPQRESTVPNDTPDVSIG